jgi:hypothetical protein
MELRWCADVCAVCILFQLPPPRQISHRSPRSLRFDTVPACLLHLFIHLHVSPHSLFCSQSISPNLHFSWRLFGSAKGFGCCVVLYRNAIRQCRKIVNNENSIFLEAQKKKKKHLENLAVCGFYNNLLTVRKACILFQISRVLKFHWVSLTICICANRESQILFSTNNDKIMPQLDVSGAN